MHIFLHLCCFCAFLQYILSFALSLVLIWLFYNQIKGGSTCFYEFYVISRNAYRAEIASFLAPVPGESVANERIRERIEFISNILFLIEDLYLAIGSGFLVNPQSSSKINVRSPLYWVRNQLATHVKELMIAKRTGWQVLKNLKNQVSFLFIIFYISYVCLCVCVYSYTYACICYAISSSDFSFLGFECLF